MATPLNGLPPGFTLDEPDNAGLPPGFALDDLTPQPETTTDQMLGGGAATLDILANAAVGGYQGLVYPFRRVAGLVTGETAQDIEASQARVANALASPVGRALGVEESAAYQRNPANALLNYVAENMDKGADWIVNSTVGKKLGLQKPDVVNMMQNVTLLAPAKIPGAGRIPGVKAAVETPRKVVRGAVNKMQDVFDPKTKFYMDVAEGRGGELVRAARAPEAEIIPGVRPTFAQATADIGLPRVAAVGEQAAKLQPTEALRVKDVQEAARVGEIKAIEQTPAALKAAEKARRQASEPFYVRAEKAGDVVDVTPTLSYIETLINENPGNDVLVTELRKIGRGLTDETGAPRVNAKEISSSIDGIKSMLAKEDNAFIKGELTAIKDQLVGAVPGMKEGQRAFRKGSQPINEMKIGKFLREKLEAPLPEGAQRAGAFAGAVREAPRTIRQALDNTPRYENLTEALSPDNQVRVDRVIMDLSRDARIKEMAQMGREAAPDLAKPAGTFTGPAVLERVMTIANEILRRLEGKINEKMAMEIALEFLDARKAADALETAMQRSAKRGRIPQPVAKPPDNPAAAAASRALKRAPVATAPNQMRNEEVRNRMAR